MMTAKHPCSIKSQWALGTLHNPIPVLLRKPLLFLKTVHPFTILVQCRVADTAFRITF